MDFTKVYYKAMKKKRIVKRKNKKEFSKTLLIQESVLVWIVTIAFFILSFICITNQYFGELPWLTAMAACPWAAYAVSQSFYYHKAEKENIKGGIKYDSVMKNYEEIIEQALSNCNGDSSEEGVG